MPIVLAQILTIPLIALSITQYNVLATGGGDFLYAENNDVPNDRRPLFLSFNASGGDSGEIDVAKVELTLYENDMITEIGSVTYAITLTSLSNNDIVLRDVFFSEHGRMILRLQSDDMAADTRIEGRQEEFLNAWAVDEDGISILSPRFLENTTYKITVSLFGFDSIRNLLSPENVPEADFLFDTGESVIQVVALKPEIKIGANGLADTPYAVLDNNSTATWNATSFAMFSNGTMFFKMHLRYLSENPQASTIYNAAYGEQEIPIGGKLRYIGSAFFMRTFAVYVNPLLGEATRNPVTSINPIVTDNPDNKTSYVEFRGSYLQPLVVDTGHIFDAFEIQLSWLRVFEDNSGSRYYQWLQGNCTFIESSCPWQSAALDEEYHSLSGSFSVFMPKPENFTTNYGLGDTFDYVIWLEQNALQSRESIYALPLLIDDFTSNLTLTSFSGRLENISIDYDSHTVTWTIPMNVDDAKLPMAGFIHQHVTIPKAAIDWQNATSSLTVNGEPILLPSPSFVMDPYSSDDSIIFHILLLKGKLIEIGQEPLEEAKISFSFYSEAVIPEFGSMVVLIASIGMAAFLISRLHFRAMI